MKKHCIQGVVLLSLLLVSLTSCQPKADPAVNEDEIISHISYLASEELGGRYPGTAGDSLAAIYIRDQFESYGLELPGENGFQAIEVVTEVNLGANNSFGWNRRMLTVEADFMPLSFSGNGNVRSGLVFAGYGIHMDKPDFKYNDYANLDVAGKIVMILEGGPKVEEGQEDSFVGYLSHRSKILNATDNGAIGVVFVAGSLFDDKDELKFVKKKEPSVGIPVIRLKRSLADELLQQTGQTIDVLEEKHTSGEKGGFAFRETVFFQTDIVSEAAQTQNVMGFLNVTGSDGEILVIGAHYDHLGMGGKGSSSRVPDTTAVHYGADDNASGVSALIELAGSLSSKKDQLPFSILFIAFAGEEMGLIGSKYYTKNPIYSIENVKAMLNMDMVGRLSEEKNLAVGGVGTALEFEEMIKKTNSDLFELALANEGYGPSDHAAFYAKDLPVLYFSTGAHMDYHTPDDTVDKINGAGMVEIVNFLDKVVLEIGALGNLSYQEAGPKQQAAARARFKVTLGIMPDVASNATNGLRVEFVTEGKPAQRAGMQKADRIVGLNGLPVTNIYDYMTRLQTLEEGQTVSVEVIRDEKKIVLIVQL